MCPRAVLLSVLLSAALLAQPAFDVASVKPGGPVRPDGLLDINLGAISHGTVTLTNTTLSECIRFAYGLMNEEQVAGPDWIRDRSLRYQIVAKAPPDTPDDQIHRMMQTLLSQRFRLETHYESRKVPHLDLTVSRNGPNMPRPEGDGPSERRHYSPGRLSYTRLSMSRLVLLLSRLLKQPVFDKTGLTGVYDVELNWQPDDAPTDPGVAPKPDIFAAVRRQLGLNLEASKEPLNILVVDRAGKVPLEN